MTLPVVAGVDIGSLTAKTVILDSQSTVLAANVVQRGIVDEAAARASLRAALKIAGLKPKHLRLVVTTGYGRSLVRFGDRNVTEISCHARGADHLLSGVRTVIDIGGQDSKVISLDGRGMVNNFAMNDKCAAGTGRFLEVMARALKIPLVQMERLSMESVQPAAVSSLCTVFAESEVISLVAKRYPKANVVAGIHEAIGRRLVGLTKIVGLQGPVMMTGGVAKNSGVVRVLERLLGQPITVAADPQIVGALGAALYALDDLQDET